MPLTGDDVDRFERSRPRLEAIAYRLLGSADEAQDVVQETFLRWHAADVDRVEVPEAWLTKVLTNLCLNQLTSARARRVTYVGRWLPEPLLAGDPMLGPAETAEQREAVSYAVLTLMERLSPNERAVYVLREAFDHSHREIAEILEITEAASQQIFHRAKKNVAYPRSRSPTSTRPQPSGSSRSSSRPPPAAGPMSSFAFSPRTPSPSATAEGRSRHAPRRSREPWRSRQFVWGMLKPAGTKRAIVGGSPEIYAWTANGEPAVVAVVEDRVVAIMCLEVTPEGIAACRTQANPDKLERATDQWAAADHGEPLLVM